MVKLAPHELEAQAKVMAGHPLWLLSRTEDLERAAVERFAQTASALGNALAATEETRMRVLEAVSELAQAVDLSRCLASAHGYGRRVLWEDERAGWSIAAITLRFGQTTEVHDHNGWGGAVIVQGIERDRRFAMDASGELVMISARDYPAGTGYLFDAADIHSPIGVDPAQDTVALHVLCLDHAGGTIHQRLHEHGGEAVAA